MSQPFTARFRRGRSLAVMAIAAVAIGTSGFSSCAGTTGPLFAPLSITPNEVLLRASAASQLEAIGLARIEGGENGDRYAASIQYVKDAGAEWLTVEVAGRMITLRADPAGIPRGVYTASVIVEAEAADVSGAFTVEFEVTP